MDSVNSHYTAASLKKLALCIAIGGALVLMSTGCMSMKDIMNLNILSNYLGNSLGV